MLGLFTKMWAFISRGTHHKSYYSHFIAKLISDQKVIVNKEVFMDRALAAGNVGDWKLIWRSL